MNKIKIVTLVVVPALLVITGFVAYLAIIREWNFEIVSTLIFLFAAVYILSFEKIIPFRKYWKTEGNGYWPDLKHLLFSTIIFDALGKTLALSFVIWSKRILFATTEIWNVLPFYLSFIIAVLLGELLPYLYHRFSHEGKEDSYLSMFLWKVHSIHHLPKSLNWFKTNWMHPINMFFNTFLKMGPLLLLGFSEDVLFLVGVLHVVIAYISHANIKCETGFLDYLIVTPKLHRFHHSKSLVEAKNFGNIVPFWDIVFKTYYNRHGEVDKVGIVESYLAYPRRENYLQQITFPFKFILKDCCKDGKAST